MGLFFSEEAAALRERGLRDGRQGVWPAGGDLGMNLYYQQGLREAEEEARRRKEDEERNKR